MKFTTLIAFLLLPCAVVEGRANSIAAPDEAQYYGSQADVAQVDEEGALLRNVNSGAQSTPASVATSGKGKGSKGSKGMRSKGMGMRSKGMGMGSKGMGSKAKGAIRL